jgi:MFS transporter, AAHS family, 4-hydroxybenzoate transporter
MTTSTASMGSGAIVNVDEVLDTARFSGLSLAVAICAGLILILDGLDIQVIGLMAPDIVRDFRIDRDALAPALAAALFGMALGAPGVGAFGDRWGRRPALLLSTLVFGLATLFAATSRNVGELTLWRFITGIGLGGALPSASALLAEFTSREVRSQALGAALVGVPLGGILGAALAAGIVSTHGWRAMFVIGGTLPVAAAAAMYFVMPESPRFLASRSRCTGALAAMLNRIERNSLFSADDSFVLGYAESHDQRAGLRALFARALRWDTTITSLAFLTNILAIYAFYNWSPIVLTAMGFTFDEAVAGAAVAAVQVGMYAVAANVFPTRCRTAGVGLALGAGRLGGILSSFAGGALLAQAGPRGFFGGIGVAVLLTLATILLLRRHVPRHPVTETRDGSISA